MLGRKWKYTTEVIVTEPQPIVRVTEGGSVDVEIQHTVCTKAVSQCVGRVSNALDIPYEIIESEVWIELPRNVKDESTYTVRLTWPAFTRPRVPDGIAIPWDSGIKVTEEEYADHDLVRAAVNGHHASKVPIGLTIDGQTTYGPLGMFDESSAR